MPFVVEGGFGVYTGNSPKRIAEKVGVIPDCGTRTEGFIFIAPTFCMPLQVTALVSDDAALQRMSSRAKHLSRPDATRAIAADIAAVLLSNK